MPDPGGLTRWSRRGSGVLLGIGTLVLVGTVVVVAVGVVRHLGQPDGSILPVSWARTGGPMLLPLTGSRWVTSWQFDLMATVVVGAVALLYLAGVASAYTRGRPWSWWRTCSFLAGLGVCLLAVSSSVGVYDMALFSAHMLGHLALVMLAPMLLVPGRPLTLIVDAVSDRRRERVLRILHSPVVSLWFSPPVALATYTVVIVGTHLTGLMNVIMQRPWAGQLEHLAYVVVGFQFFTVAIGGEPLRWSLSPLGRQILLALAMGVDTLTGVVLLQGNQAIAMGGVVGGVDPVAQTQLGGAIMWVGGDALMVVVMVVIAVPWLSRQDSRPTTGRGWLEQARVATLAGNTSFDAANVEQDGADPDDDERALAAYNAWLTDLAHRRPER